MNNIMSSAEELRMVKSGSEIEAVNVGNDWFIYIDGKSIEADFLDALRTFTQTVANADGTYLEIRDCKIEFEISISKVPGALTKKLIAEKLTKETIAEIDEVFEG